MRHRKSLPRAFPDYLGCEKRVENVGPRLFGYSGASIPHSDLYPVAIPPRTHTNCSLRAKLLSDDVPDGMRRVNDQIQDYLVELASNALR